MKDVLEWMHFDIYRLNLNKNILIPKSCHFKLTITHGWDSVIDSKPAITPLVYLKMSKTKMTAGLQVWCDKGLIRVQGIAIES